MPVCGPLHVPFGGRLDFRGALWLPGGDELVSATKTCLVVEEHIQEDHGCADVVLITLTYRQPRALRYEYKLTNTHGAGTLAPA